MSKGCYRGFRDRSKFENVNTIGICAFTIDTVVVYNNKDCAFFQKALDSHHLSRENALGYQHSDPTFIRFQNCPNRNFRRNNMYSSRTVANFAMRIGVFPQENIW
jgi:hypothetical protein